MKLTILQEKLKEGLVAAERVPPKPLSLPSLGGVFLVAEKNFLCLSATNLEVGVRWWGLAKIEKEGAALTPIKTLSGLIGSFPNKPVVLDARGLVLKIECDNYKTQINGLAPEDFPIIPNIGGGESLEVDAPVFLSSLGQIVDIASPSASRPEISGIYFLFQKDQIRVAATDGFRLGEKKIFEPSPPPKKECSLILPQAAAREIINIFNEKTKPKRLKIYLSPNQVLFESQMAETPHPHIQITSRLIEGEFPNYQEIIPKKHEARAVFAKNELLNQIKSASLFSGKINEIKLKINPQEGRIEVLSQSSELGDYYSFLSAKIAGKAMTVSFNHRFLIDGLLNVQGAEAVLELTGEDGPAILKDGGDQSYLYVVMPIKAT